MSAVAQSEHRWVQQRPLIGLPARARTYLLQMVAAAAGAVVLTSWLSRGHIDWVRLAIIVTAGAVAHAFAVRTPGNQVFHSGLAFAVAAAILLPPQGIVLVCVAQHLTDWVRQRYPWYIQSFNIANYTLSALSAWAVRDALGLHQMATPGVGRVLAASAGGAAFVLVNHAALARMLMLARGHSLESSGLFGLDGVVTDLVLAAIGVSIGLSLTTEPAAAFVAALPLVVLHRALAVPNLRAQALRDHKTGLLNARGIDERAREELARARRFGRPLSLLMIDIDDLRSINNGHGHIAGDAALVAVSDAFKASMRDYDLCARFGGDEFVIVLPETSGTQAVEIAERVRSAVGATTLRQDDCDVPVGISIGVATLGRRDQTLSDLMRRADTATYASKAAGGNSVSLAGS